MQSSTQRSRDIKIEMGYFNSTKRNKHSNVGKTKKVSLKDHRWASKKGRYGIS